MKGKEREGKERKGIGRKWKPCISDKSVIFHVSIGGRTPGAIAMKFGLLAYMANIINCEKYDYCSFDGLNLARV
jgi:hypothetical protein